MVQVLGHLVGHNSQTNFGFADLGQISAAVSLDIYAAISVVQL
jgi:hypothetical protein